MTNRCEMLSQRPIDTWSCEFYHDFKQTDVLEQTLVSPKIIFRISFFDFFFLNLCMYSSLMNIFVVVAVVVIVAMYICCYCGSNMQI